MAKYKLSGLAETDLTNIYEYGILNFGLQQAKEYLAKLEETFQVLTDNKNLGRGAYEFYPELRRFAFESHIIFYLPTDFGILIVRVLNHSMDFDRHL